jgi:transcriptional antiterminator RfaH
MSLLSDQYFWYPVYTISRSEKKVSTLLTKKNIVHYLPLKKTLKQWSDRKKWVEEPLLPSYIFVYVSNKEYKDVLETSGVVRYLYFSGKIANINDQQIDFLKAYLSSGYEPEITFRNLEKGQKIEIISGDLKGLTGELIAYQNENRLILRLEALGQSVLLKIPAGLIKPVN